jgi:AmmeMemoRadiSam system protein B
MTVRNADFAGSWYPAGSAACEKEIRSFLAQEGFSRDIDNEYIGGIVPHAGWYYSGAIACNVIKALSTGSAPDAVVVFGMHLHPDSPCYIMPEGSWETPFGEIDIHAELAGQLTDRFAFQIEGPRNYAQDNTIELQLPFIKYFFKDAKLVPIGVPPNPASLEIGESVARIAADLGIRVIVIGSTDLTHYGNNYGFTSHGTGSSAVDWVRNTNDRRLIDAIVEMAPEKVISEALTSHNACCAGAVSTAIAAAKGMGATRAEPIVYATSYDKSPGDSFVGYVGVVFG